MRLQPLPRLVALDASLAYAPPAWPRLVSGAGALLCLAFPYLALAPWLPDLLFWGLAFLLGLAALSDDRWIFVPGEEGAERRFGVQPFSRSWRIPRAGISSVELRAGEAGESVVDRGDVRGVMETALLGTGRGPWAALVLVLEDRRSIAVAVGDPREGDALAADGTRIAALLGLAFVDSRAASA